MGGDILTELGDKMAFIKRVRRYGYATLRICEDGTMKVRKTGEAYTWKIEVGEYKEVGANTELNPIWEKYMWCKNLVEG